MDAFFSPTARGRAWPHFALPAAQILAFALPPFRYRPHVFLPIVLGLVLATWSNLCTEALNLRLLMILQAPWYLTTVSRLVFYPVPEKEYWRSDKSRAETMSLSFFDKMKWSAALYCSPRGIGWNYQVKGVPEYKPPHTKAQFFFQQIERLAVCFILLDAVQMYIVEYYYGNPDVDLLTLTPCTDSWLLTLFNKTIGMTKLVLNCNYVYIQLAIISVLVGGSQPKDWPPVFGRIGEAYTLRRFWNTFWQQIPRHMLINFTKGFKSLLKIPRGTWLSSYFDLYFVFTLSAFGHGLVTYAMPYGTGYTFSIRFWLYFKFMLFQAPAIHLEDFMIRAYKNLAGQTGPVHEARGPELWQRVIGYLWVACWWYFIGGDPAAAVLRLGIARLDPLPFSIVRPLVASLQKNHQEN